MSDALVASQPLPPGPSLPTALPTFGCEAQPGQSAPVPQTDAAGVPESPAPVLHREGLVSVGPPPTVDVLVEHLQRRRARRRGIPRSNAVVAAPGRRGTDVPLPPETAGATLASGHASEETTPATAAERTEPTRS